MQDDNKVYGIMSKVVKEVSKGSAIDDALIGIGSIQTLNEFNGISD